MLTREQMIATLVLQGWKVMQTRFFAVKAPTKFPRGSMYGVCLFHAASRRTAVPTVTDMRVLLHDMVLDPIVWSETGWDDVPDGGLRYAFNVIMEDDHATS